MNGIIRFLKDWTLPVSIAVGTVSYLTFNYVPALDEAGDWLGSVFDVLFPISVFMTRMRLATGWDQSSTYSSPSPCS